MRSSITTVMDGVIPSLYHSPWNPLLHCPHASNHVHFGYPSYPSKQIPSNQHAYHYLDPNSPIHVREHEILSQMMKAINGEYAAIACYQKLKNLAPTKNEKTIINEIRKDEIRHFNTFSNLYTQLTGKKHTPIITEKCPSDYKKGIDYAFNDEQETVDLYLDIAYHTDNKKVKEEFLRAAHDEQNHAVWFLYFMR